MDDNFYSHLIQFTAEIWLEHSTLKQSRLIITPLNQLYICYTLSLPVHSVVTKYTIIHTITLQYHILILFHITVLSTSNLVVKCPKIADHKEFAFELLQMPKRREFSVHILLVNSQHNDSPLLN